MPSFFTLIFLFFTALFSSFVQASFFAKQTQASFLKSEQAFAFQHVIKNNQLFLQWQIAEGYYLYKKEIQIYHEQNNQKTALDFSFPVAEKHFDEFFGEVEIYRNKLSLALSQAQLPEKGQLVINYQGCTKGFCYPPETKWVSLDDVANIEQERQNKIQSAVQNEVFSETVQLHQQLQQNKYHLLWFFLLGLGLAFTPCVLPMLPLLSAIVIGTEHRPHSLKALALSAVYVQGMALTYSLLGLLVALIGLPLQIALQSPFVLIALSVIFIGLALSMFGLFEIRLPTKLQNRLAQYSQQQKSGAFMGVFVMGMIAGLVASPCTTAPLSAALLYVAQSGDLVTGGLSLYLLALGMGTPLILITVFGNKILPKSGNWLIKVKQLFGFVMLLLPIILLARIFPEYDLLLKRIWIASLLVWLVYHLGKSWLGWLIIILGLLLTKLYHQPLQQWVSAQFSSTTHRTLFKPVKNYAELMEALQQNPKSLAMLDLYADWCVACKEFEQYIFSDERIQKQFEQVLLLQVDMTKNSKDNRTLMQELQILGLPTIIFFDHRGQEITGSRVTGFMSAEEFNPLLHQLLNP